MEEYQAPLGDVFDVGSPRVGERLRRARTEKGLELTDIARDTRVPVRHLAAIEGDAHESLPALTYSIGFVKTFARYVGLPPEEMAAQFKAETNKVAHVPQTMPLEPLDESRVPPRGVIAGALLAVVIVVAGVWAWGNGMFNREPMPPAPAEMAAPVEPAPEEEYAANATDPALAEPTGDIGVPPVDPTAAAGPQPIDPALAATAAGPVVITANSEVWIKVYDAAQQTVKMGTLKAGESYALPPGREDLQLWTGRAGALRITVNGRAIPSLGGPEEMVQDVSLAPASLLSRGR
ncbi:helix-turn-helix domain-containing protein [Sphingoaurantiacus capsulatus]|uniref:Helix-turn-helix domain-containing protein n=1 Tax=Sphingoaurantiacus capsulatus TaxID=1771310 RepID=A0ABV7XBG4_9SPHN